MNITNSTQGGPITATNLLISGQTINLLSSSARFYTAGATTFDANTVLNDQSGATTQDLQFNDAFVNYGTINNPININSQTSGSSPTATPFTNNGGINYTTALNGATIGAYSIGGAGAANSGFPDFLANNNVINVSAAPGGNYGTTATILPTEVSITNELNGTGTVNVRGSAQNSASINMMAATESNIVFSKPVTGTNTFNLNDGQVEFDDTSAGTVNFQDGSSILVLPDVTSVATSLAIRGFQSGDAIGLGTGLVKSASYSAATGMVNLFTAGGTMLGSLNIAPTGAQVYGPNAFTVVSGLMADTGQGIPTGDGGGGTNISYLLVNAAAPCYCPGTLIRTDRGDVAVEQLAVGDRVITLDGTAEPIRWLGRRAFDGRFVSGRRDILPVCIRAGALGDAVPARDLWVSPLHAMFLHGGLVPAGELVNGCSVTQAEAVERVEYIHIELAQHRVIWAEGAASESFVDDNSRAMFHNAREFAALYPDSVCVPALYCAPRIVDGVALEAVKREIDQRAGLAMPGVGGALQGCIDGLHGTALRGWAQDGARPEVAVCLEVLVGTRVVARTVANLFRQDLRLAGLGSGCHGFRVDLPMRIGRGAITVRRAADGAVLATLARKERQAA